MRNVAERSALLGCGWVLGGLGLLGCQGSAAAPPANPARCQAELHGAAPVVASPRSSFYPVARPKLVLVVVLDQFRADYLTRFEANFGERGFKQLLHDGASWTGHYGHYATYTGPGHALILSGSYPYVNGIGANKFWNAESSRSEAMVFDPGSRIFGLEKTDPDMDVSPRNFIGSTLGDELFLDTGGRSKTISLATKGRGAILLGGRLGKTFFMNDDTGEMTSSSYYYKELPAWVSAWNRRKLADSFFGKKWEHALPDGAYVALDNAPNEGDFKGLGKTFPHVLTGKLAAPGPDYYEALTRTPFANELEFDFAKAAIEGEQLGTRGVTDVLAVSISATDMAGHDYGPFSQELQDLVVRTDRQLGDFVGWVQQKLGSDAVLTVVTADHGATPVPEQMSALGFDAARIKKKAIAEAIDSALTARFGAPGPAETKPLKAAKADAKTDTKAEPVARKWVVALEDPHIFLDRKLIAEKKLDPEAVERVAGEAALTLRGFAGYLTRSQLLTGNIPQTELARSLQRSYHAPHGGDVVMWTMPFYFWGKYGEKDQGSTHGTAYRYDAEVPVLMMGRGVRPGRYGVREMVDLAPTLSYLLGIVAPAGSVGSVVPVLSEP